MYTLSAQTPNINSFTTIVFTEPQQNELKLLRLFYKAAKKYETSFSEYTSWVNQTEKELMSFEKDIYQKSNLCPTISHQLKKRFDIYTNVINRFENQLKTFCELIKKEAEKILKQLKSIKIKSQVMLMYLVV
ncbi:hypothetical protein ACFQ1Q_12100 [Winogradskyella litorisediminis]|uniref:Uncharacterized protein n=1 Tax=Winogradskyella litorisediminis TaxID=1156618 RepID=A0ABW3NCA5_9FLAO